VRRTVPVLAATAGGLALLANFHTSPATTGAATDIAAGTTTTLEPTTAVVPTTSALPASSTTTRPPSTTTTTSPGNIVTGPAAHNRWGEVQVRVTMSGSHIENIEALQLPGDNSHSAALSREAAPILRREALQAQSANIDLVSGATLTSESYIESLQGALDRAGH
jgi:uncharacterized protein with FMN-binding domain